MIIKAVMNPCSTHTLISHKLANKLKIKAERASVNLTVINNIGEKTIKRTNIHIKDKRGAVTIMDAYLLEKICGPIPEAPLNQQLPKEWNLDEEKELADPFFRQPSAPDMLLGVEICSEIVENGLKKSPREPSVLKTTLGWVIFGRT